MWSILTKLKDDLIPSGTITERSVKSGIWVTLINVLDRALQLTKLIVLANLLSPSDFGLMGIALLTVAVFKQFSNLGIDTALIQREETDIDSYLNTAWIMNLGRSVAITGVVVLIAPYAAEFFGEPRATDIIRAIAFSTLLLGLRNPGIVYLQKKLKFHKQFVYKLSSTVVSVSVAIGFAIVYGNVWALVFGYLSGDIITVVMSYLMHEYRPWFEFKPEFAKELYGYGKWVTASSIVLFLVTQGDDAFIGWFLGATALGFYQLAYRFSNAPATEVTKVISDVVFPTYAKLQADKSKLRNGFLKTLTLVTAVSFPIAVGLIIITPYFTRLFLGEQWLPAVVLMQVLAVFGASRSIGAATGPLYRAIGRPDIDTKLATGHVILLAPTIYITTMRWGLTGASIAIVAVHLLVTGADTYLATEVLNIDYSTFIHPIKYPLSASLVMGGILYGITKLSILGSDLATLILLVLVGITLYSGLILIMGKYLDYQIGAVVKMLKGSLTS